MRLLALLVALVLLTGAATAAEIAGTAKVTDGDTIRIGDARIRLWGIDVPERRQTCQGRNGDVYECGRDSAAVLNELTRGRQVECEVKNRDRYGRVVGVSGFTHQQSVAESDAKPGSYDSSPVLRGAAVFKPQRVINVRV
jgi:endonuclease YncB( thermonuclease family)